MWIQLFELVYSSIALIELIFRLDSNSGKLVEKLGEELNLLLKVDFNYINLSSC